MTCVGNSEILILVRNRKFRRQDAGRRRINFRRRGSVPKTNTTESNTPPNFRRIWLCGCELRPQPLACAGTTSRGGPKNTINGSLRRWIRSGYPVPEKTVLKAWESNGTLAEFAKHFSIRTPFAARVLDTYGLEFTRTMGRRFRAGEKLPDLALEQGVSQKFLSRLIQDGGTKVPRGRRRPDYDAEAVRKRFSETRSIRRIQIEFKMSWATARSVLTELGLV